VSTSCPVMDSTKILELLDQLDDEIDDLEDSLTPISKNRLSDRATKLPLLDKAKLYVLTTYAIESIIFSYLRLNNVKARDHPVFNELSRVKQYFDKLKAAEMPVSGHDNPVLDKKAASRMIRAGLSGNEKHDLERAEKQAKEKARAHIRFEAEIKTRKEQPGLVGANGTGSSQDSESGSQTSSLPINQTQAGASKKRKLEAGDPTQNPDGRESKKKHSAKQMGKAAKKKGAK